MHHMLQVAHEVKQESSNNSHPGFSGCWPGDSSPTSAWTPKGKCRTIRQIRC